MLKKRIISCLDIKDGRTVKGVNFLDLIDAGDPVALAKRYVQEGADELVFLDITATVEKRKTLIELVSRIASELEIPFTVGGGINTLEDAAAVIEAGADKIAVNSAAIEKPELIAQISERFGSQCVVVAIDTKLIDGAWRVVKHGGRTLTPLLTLNWARQVQELGAGEIMLTSMNNDGTKNGFALGITKQVAETVQIPVIASGGAGAQEDFASVFKFTDASAALAASVFHFEKIAIPDLKAFLKTQNIPVRCP